MTKLIRTNTSSKKQRGARKIDPRKATELEKSFDSLKDKWASVPSFAKAYPTAKAKTKATRLAASTKANTAKPELPITPVQPKPATGKFVTDTGTLPAPKTYTGDKVLGIAVMHKSCLQPVFSEEAAKDSAKMRRG